MNSQLNTCFCILHKFNIFVKIVIFHFAKLVYLHNIINTLSLTMYLFKIRNQKFQMANTSNGFKNKNKKQMSYKNYSILNSRKAEHQPYFQQTTQQKQLFINFKSNIEFGSLNNSFQLHRKIITQNEDFEYEDQQQLYLNAIEYKLNQNLWQKLCLQLSLSEKLQILSINLCSSTLNTNLLQQLIESISNLQNLLYVELDMKHTYLDDNSIQVLSGVMKIPNLIKFIAYVSQCNIAVGTLHQFWKRNKEQIREKFNYFYIYHHFYSFGHDKDFYEEIMASKSSIYLDQFSESTFV